MGNRDRFPPSPSRGFVSRGQRSSSVGGMGSQGMAGQQQQQQLGGQGQQGHGAELTRQMSGELMGVRLGMGQGGFFSLSLFYGFL